MRTTLAAIRAARRYVAAGVLAVLGAGWLADGVAGMQEWPLISGGCCLAAAAILALDIAARHGRRH